MKLLVCLLLCGFAAAQQQPIETARTNPANLPPLFGPHGGTAVWGEDYLFVTDIKSPSLAIDMQAPVPMTPSPGSALSMRLVKMRVGVTHAYQYFADGKPSGNRSDIPGYNPDSYPQPGIPQGTLSEKHTITSKIYDGMKADYWFYARRESIQISPPRSWSGRTAKAWSTASTPNSASSPSPKTWSRKNSSRPWFTS